MACKGRIPKKTQVRELPAFPLSQAHHLQLIKAEALGGKASTGRWGEPCWEGEAEPDSERTLDLSKPGGV